jgi:hypothetical protein
MAYAKLHVYTRIPLDNVPMQTIQSNGDIKDPAGEDLLCGNVRFVLGRFRSLKRA